MLAQDAGFGAENVDIPALRLKLRAVCMELGGCVDGPSQCAVLKQLSDDIDHRVKCDLSRFDRRIAVTEGGRIASRCVVFAAAAPLLSHLPSEVVFEALGHDARYLKCTELVRHARSRHS
eukprot:gnl/TRDRNA2_/TRDRNA2_85583_c0_seq4.p1 gnl/TRDRNA2_/TRDRNA2_85583_c0~~gnl/TRDRNA2_/TRDRNA2_85583_c0_seq4.p1  ORF type:complete len:120 (+),score=13.79 gnl/TRDRNA2_/TRDRNA2_85583_c0_seq4:187-546(+)